MYDSDNMALNMTVLCVAIKVFSLILIIVAYGTYKPPVEIDEKKRAFSALSVDTEVKPEDIGLQNNGFIPTDDENTKYATNADDSMNIDSIELTYL